MNCHTWLGVACGMITVCSLVLCTVLSRILPTSTTTNHWTAILSSLVILLTSQVG